MRENWLLYISIFVSMIGAVVSLIATALALRAQRTAERGLLTKEGTLSKGGNIEELGSDTGPDEDTENGQGR